MTENSASEDSLGTPYSSHGAGRPLIVGVGGAAGGSEALRLFLRRVPNGHGLAIVVVLHQFPSSLPALLTACSALPVSTAEDGVQLQAEQIYLVPENTLASLDGGVLHLTSAVTPTASWHPIDHFFQALAQDQGGRAVAVLLSGTGSDGTVELKAISAAGGLALVQEPTSAQRDAMQHSAVDSGIADHVLPPAQLADEVVAYAGYLAAQTPDSDAVLRKQVLELLPRICDVVLKVTGHDFKPYKSSSLVRRILRRVQVLRLVSAAQYLQLVASDHVEAERLFRELLINVTAFFRDPEAFIALAREVLPRFFNNLQHGEGVRVWVPGCATGEEAYTLAILLREQMDGLAAPPEVQIFATDIDAEALAVARTGSYPLAIAEQISPDRLARFFIKKGQRFQVTREIRDLVFFSVHNLIEDPPFSRLDLISCRNLLSYLGDDLQKKIIPIFHYALRTGGHLLLGPTENLNDYRELFHTVNARYRISIRLPATSRPAELPLRSATAVRPASSAVTSAADAYSLMERLTLAEFAPRTVVVDPAGRIVCASGNLDKYLTVTPGAVHNSVIRLARTGLRMGLQSALSAAIATRHKVAHDSSSLRTAAGVQRVRIIVQPLSNEDAELYYIAFQDVGGMVATGEAAPTAHADDAAALIAHLERELVSSRSALERSAQDLDAANEELRARSEELLSMNAELESSKDAG